MATNNFERELCPFESMIVDAQSALNGSNESLFSVRGNRLVLELQITSISTSLTLEVENSFDPDNYYTVLHNETYSNAQVIRIKLSDIHKFFKISLTSVGSSNFVLGATISDDSANDNTMNAIAGLSPFPYDEIEITSKNANRDPTEVVYRDNGADVSTLTITYDGDGDLQKVVRS